MHPAGRENYPVSKRLEAKFRADPNTFYVSLSLEPHPLVAEALEYIGEYEHGSVDIQDVLPQFQFGPTAGDYNRQAALEAMADLLFDFVGTSLMSDAVNGEDV